MNTIGIVRKGLGSAAMAKREKILRQKSYLVLGMPEMEMQRNTITKLCFVSTSHSSINIYLYC